MCLVEDVNLDKYKLRRNEMEPYIEYSIKGINEYDVSGCNWFVPENDFEVNKIEIICENGSMSGIKLLYKENQIIDIEKAQTKVEQFITSILCNLDITVKNFDFYKKEIYNPNKVLTDKNEEIVLKIEDFEINPPIHLSYNISFFKKSYEASIRNMTENDMNYFLTIQKVKDLNLRYLILYQLLLNLVPKTASIGKSRKQQKDVINYISDVYNNDANSEKIESKQTTRVGSIEMEDDLTYYRNILGHNDISNINEDIINSENVTVGYCRLINKVIYFLLTK